jgi:hypothetical protein
MNEDIKFMFGVVEGRESLEELREERSGLFDEHSNHHSGILLLIQDIPLLNNTYRHIAVMEIC